MINIDIFCSGLIHGHHYNYPIKKRRGLIFFGSVKLIVKDHIACHRSSCYFLTVDISKLLIQLQHIHSLKSKNCINLNLNLYIKNTKHQHFYQNKTNFEGQFLISFDCQPFPPLITFEGKVFSQFLLKMIFQFKNKAFLNI